MSITRSQDGTVIAYEASGDGPPLILVDGALCYRASGPSRPLAAQLAERFTVYTYDRRGRGESGDTPPYALEREVEDLQAVIQEAGGSAYVYGISSGAMLALEAANRGAGVTKLALYEPPLIIDDGRPPVPEDYVPTLHALLADDRRGDAVKLFMRQVGLPSVLIGLMRFMPAWTRLKAVAHTLPYDAATLTGLQAGAPLPTARWTAATMPTLVVIGGKSPQWWHRSTRSLANVLPSAQHCVLDGQNHMVKPKALAPLLTEFLAGAGREQPVVAAAT